MKKTFLILSACILSSHAIAQDSNVFNGKNFISEGANSNIELRFTSRDEAILETPCYDANGNYSIVHKGDDSYQVKFALQSYTNVKENCSQTYSDKRTTIAALQSLTSNNDTTFSLDNNYNVSVIMTGDNGSMISYKSN